jgi:hypothetical protein
MTTIRVNLRNSAITQHSNGFTSYAAWNGLQMGAGPDGVFVLNYGQKDIYTTTSDERNISAWFELPNTQLGSDKVKQGRRLYVGGEFNGSMTIKATTSGETAVETTYNITPRNTSYVQHVVQVPMTHTQKGEYWSFVVANVAGSDFSIDFIDAVMVPVARRFGL